MKMLKFFKKNKKKKDIKVEHNQTFEGNTEEIIFCLPNKKQKKFKRILRNIKYFFKGIDTRYIREDIEIDEKETNKTCQPQYSAIIEYSYKLRKDKERCEILKQEYINYLKLNKTKKIIETKTQLLSILNDISLAESYLKAKIIEIKKNNQLSINEKQKIVNDIYEISGIEKKSSPAHLRNTKNTGDLSTIENLKRQEKAIESSKHFTNEQKKKMLEELKQELLNLTKIVNDEEKTKTIGGL